MGFYSEQFEKAVESIDRSLETNNNHAVIEAIKNTSKAHLPISHDLSSVSLEVLQQRYQKWAESVRYEVKQILPQYTVTLRIFKGLLT